MHKGDKFLLFDFCFNKTMWPNIIINIKPCLFVLVLNKLTFSHVGLGLSKLTVTKRIL